MGGLQFPSLRSREELTSRLETPVIGSASNMKLPVDGVPLLPPNVVAPEKQTLRYTSAPKLYAIPPESQAADGEFEGLLLREHHVPKPQKNLPPHIGEYTITIEATIGSSAEFHDFSQKIGALAQDLDKFWVYGCGEPLSPLVTTLSFDVTPKGWHSNVDKVKEYLLQNCHQMFVVAQLGHCHWIQMPFYPLLPSLRARDAYQKADPPTKALADLHYAALKSRGGEGQLFSFAKALELAREVLDGKNDHAKEKALGLSVGTLKRSFHWLFDVGNNRYNTRHVVRKGFRPAMLHARMTGQEIMDYKHDADWILRRLVCQRLRIPTPQLRTRPETHEDSTPASSRFAPPVSPAP